MNTKNTSNAATMRRMARLTGLLYFIFAALGIYTIMYIQPRIIVSNDAAATARNMLAQESLFRLGKAAGVVTSFLFILIVLLLYRLLRGVNDHQARLMVALVVVCIPVAISSDALEITALSIFKGNALTVFDAGQSQSLAMALIKISGNMTQMLTVFWGVWLFPLGLLVYRSGFIPRVLGILLIANGLGYVIHCFTFLLFPQQLSLVLKFVFPLYFMGEVPFIFWLMIKGVR
ncbi:MAG: DUF4386 domain-containing protein [Saprospiraceae bacterium]|nr:DUF4386 domain-containing protein [Saprospiraceae bacterium]